MHHIQNNLKLQELHQQQKIQHQLQHQQHLQLQYQQQQMKYQSTNPYQMRPNSINNTSMLNNNGPGVNNIINTSNQLDILPSLTIHNLNLMDSSQFKQLDDRAVTSKPQKVHSQLKKNTSML